jgi:hypothetical protein
MMARWCLLLVSLIAPPNVNAQDEEAKAILGNMAGGTVNTSSSDLEFAFQRATEMAQARGRERPTLEHVLLFLLDDRSVREMLANQYVDSQAIRSSLLYQLEATTAEAQTADASGADPALQNVMRRAFLKNMVSNKREVGAADVMAAILVEGNSYAAQVLSERGLTVEEAENEALNNYFATQAEQALQLEETQKRIGREREAQSQSGAVSSIASVASSGARAASGPRPYTLRVISEGSEKEIRFKAAVSHDGRLDLYIERTPFEIDFLASRVAALFEAIDSGDRLKVELITEMDRERRPIAGFGGSAGAIFEDQNSLARQRSGVL